MPPVRRVALVSDDLMFQSQLSAALRRAGSELATPSREALAADPGGFDAVFVDLNRDIPHRLGLIAGLRERDLERSIVAFCHHGDQETRRMAMAVGASQCITNGALQAAALRLAGIPAPRGEAR